MVPSPFVLEISTEVDLLFPWMRILVDISMRDKLVCLRLITIIHHTWTGTTTQGAQFHVHFTFYNKAGVQNG